MKKKGIKEQILNKFTSIIVIIAMILDMASPIVFADDDGVPKNPDANGKLLHIAVDYDATDAAKGDEAENDSSYIWNDYKVATIKLYITGDIPVSDMYFGFKYDTSILTPVGEVTYGKRNNKTTEYIGVGDTAGDGSSTVDLPGKWTTDIDSVDNPAIDTTAGTFEFLGGMSSPTAPTSKASGQLVVATMTFKLPDGYTPDMIPASALQFEPAAAYTNGWGVTYTYDGDAIEYVDDMKWVSYDGFAATSKTVQTLTLSTNPTKTQYYNGETLDFTGAKVTVGYSDGSTEEVSVTDAMSAGKMTADATTANSTSKKVTLTYLGKTVDVNYSTLSSVAIKTAPTKTTYDHGDTLDFTGAVLTATYTDSSSNTSTSDITVKGNSEVTEDKTKANVNDKTVKFTYHGFSATQNLTVNDSLDSISVSAPTKTEYSTGDTLNFAGGTVTAKTKSGATTTIDLTSSSVTKSTTKADISKASSTWTTSSGLQAGNQSITVSYAKDGVTKQASFDIVVNDTLSAVTITTQPTAQNKYGTSASALSYDGLVATATTTGGKSFTVNANSLTIDTTGYDSTSLSKQSFTAKYGSVTVSNKVEITLVDYVTGIDATFTSTEFDYGTSASDVASKGTYKVTYASGATDAAQAITSSMISGYIANPAGALFDANHKYNETLTITKDSYTDTQAITVNDVYSGITVTKPKKVSYKYNEELDLTDGAVTPTYKSGATGTAILMTDSSVSVTGYDKTKIGSQTLTATYNGKTNTFDVTVSDYVSGVTVTAPTSDQTSYKYGDALDLTGAKITKTYASGKTESVTPVATMVTDTATSSTATTELASTEFGSDNTATRTLKLSYTSNGITNSATYTMIVTNPVSSIAVATNPTKTTYNIGDTIDLTSGVIKVTRAAGNSTNVDMTDAGVTVSGFDSSATASNQTVTVSYEGKSTTFNVTIADSITGVTVTAPTSDQTSYKYGDALDLTGATINKVYGSGTTEAVTPTASMVTDDATNAQATTSLQASDFGADHTATRNVTLAYTTDGKSGSAQYTIKVTDQITGITVKTNPTKVKYNVGDSIDLTGGTIEITRAAGDKETKSMTDTGVTVTGFDSTSDKDPETLTVSYTENGITKTATFNVAIKDTVTAVTLVGTPKKAYNYGDAIDVSNLSLEVVRGSGTTTIPVTSSMVSGYNPNTLGTQTVTITYGQDANGNPFQTSYVVTVSDVLESITVTAPTKTSYNYGETLDLTGGTVTPVYKSGATGTAVDMTDASVSVTGYTANTVGTQTLTVTYSGKTATFDVEVKDVITDVEVTAPTSTQTSYKYGDALDLTGATINKVYGSGRKEAVTPDATMVTDDATSAQATTRLQASDFGADNTATRNVTLSYTANGITKSAQYTIKVTNPITGIAVKTNPTKTTYNIGDSIDLTGGEIEITRAAGNTETKSMSADGVTVTGFDSSKEAASQKITVSYAGYGANFNVAIKDTVTGIAIHGTPKTEYTYGDSLDLTGLSLDVARGTSTTNIPLESSMVSGYDPNTLGPQTVTVTYGVDENNNPVTTTFTVNVNDAVANTTFTAPTKTTYNLGDTLDLTGGKFTVTMKSGAVTEVTDLATNSDVTIDSSAFDTTAENAKETITLTYGGTTYSYDIKVEDPVVSTALDTTSAKTNYLYGEALDASNITIKETKKSNATNTIIVTSSMISGYNPNKLGDQTLTVTNNGKTYQYTVNVANYVKSYRFTAPTKQQYKVNEAIDLTGGKIEEVMASGATGTTIPLTDSNVTVSGFDTTAVGSKKVTVTYKNSEGTTLLTDSYQIAIVDPIASIKVKTNPTKTTYKYGEPLDLTGLEVIAVSESGEEKDIAVNDVTPSGYNPKKLGTQTITLTYSGKTTTFNVEVKDYVKGYKLVAPKKNVYKINEELDLTDGKVVEQMASGIDGQEIPLTDSSVRVSTLDTTTEGTKEVEVEYNGFKDKFNVVVTDPLSAISITKLPTKTTYKYGEKLDLTDGELLVIKESGATEKVAMTSTTPSGYDSKKLGTQQVTLTYKGQSVNFPVEVEDFVKEVKFTKPTKTTFEYNEKFSTDGAKIETIMASGAISNTVKVTPAMTTGYNATKPGKQTITVTNGDDTYTYDVTVKELVKKPTETPASKPTTPSNNGGNGTGTTTNGGSNTTGTTTNSSSSTTSTTTNSGSSTTGTTTNSSSSATISTTATTTKPRTRRSTRTTASTKANTQNNTDTVENKEAQKAEETTSTQDVERIPLVPTKPLTDTNKDSKLTGTTLDQDELDAEREEDIELIISATIAIIGLLYILFLIEERKNVKIYVEDGDERKLVGEEKITKNDREIDLQQYYEDYGDKEFSIVLDKSISKKLDDKTVNVVIHDNKKKKFTVDYQNEAYVYEIGAPSMAASAKEDSSKWHVVNKKKSK